MNAQLKPFVQGNLLLLLCWGCYLAWWIAAFRPEGGVRGMRTGWLLLPAAAAGIAGVFQLVAGIVAAPTGAGARSPLRIALTGLGVYLALLALTWALLKRPVTTELLLIVGWATLSAAEGNALRALGALSAGTETALLALTAVVAAASLVCYLAFYRLDAVKGFYDGAIPLVLVLAMTALLLGMLLWRS